MLRSSEIKPLFVDLSLCDKSFFFFNKLVLTAYESSFSFFIEVRLIAYDLSLHFYYVDRI